MERRAFLKSSCTLCILGTAGLMFPSLVSCSGGKQSVYKAAIQGNKVSIPLALFEEQNVRQVRPKGWLYDIAVHQLDDKSFHAILMKCSHMDNQLTLTGSGFQCALHGSRFNKEGVPQNGPAERTLTFYRTAIENENLIIYTS